MSVVPSAPLRRLALLALLALLPLAVAGCGSARRIDDALVPECERCHAFPPDTGAHRAHASPAPGTYAADLHLAGDVSAAAAAYDFGCAHCHPPIDPAEHVRRTGGTASAPVQRVVLAPPSPPVAGELLKSRNHPDAAYDPVTGTCSGVYCHSTGQATPDFDRNGDGALDRTPPWTRDRALGPLACSSCHDDPPRYPSGGPGAATANSHLDLDDFGWETGHFAGMAGPTHGSKHGGGNPLYGSDLQQAASPITCQACHFETVKEAPGRFFFLDTTGDYRLDRAGADASRLGARAWQQGQCATCHEPDREGTVLPARHVNGRRDVVFDRRPALPDGFATGLPDLAAAGAIRPYYVTDFRPRGTEPGGAVRFRLLADSELRATTAGTLVFTTTLESATYDAETKTCASVGCHVGRSSLEQAGVVGPLRWGQPFVWFSNCNGCHNEFGPNLPP
jgi:predicted CxxxxCH...CXXCH cytochrome family protein